MGKFIGRQQEVGVSKESSRGTIPATVGVWVPKVNFDVEDKVQKATVRGSYGKITGGDNSFVVQKWAEGKLELEMTDQSIGYFLNALFGTSTPAAAGDVYKHTLTVQESVQPTTLSLYMNDPIGSGETPAKTMAYAMAMVNSMEINAEVGAMIEAVINMIAKPHSDYTKLTPTYTAENRFRHQHLKFYVAADSASLDAATRIYLQSLKLKIERSVIRENALGTVQPVDILSRGFKISGTIKLAYQDRTYRNYMLDGSKKAIRIDIVNGDDTIGAASHPAFRLDLPVCHFDSWEPTHPLEDMAMQEITFEALYDIANSQLVSDAYLINAKASY